LNGSQANQSFILGNKWRRKSEKESKDQEERTLTYFLVLAREWVKDWRGRVGGRIVLARVDQQHLKAKQKKYGQSEPD
jgi:hypothetical protein